MLSHLSDGCCADRIDEQAEREAAAIAWLEENLGVGQPEPLLKQPPVKRCCRYPLQASVRGHARLTSLPWAALVRGPSPKSREITTVNDRARRRMAREQRTAKLRELEQMTGVVSRRAAYQLLGVGKSTIDHAIAARILTPLRQGKEKVLPIEQLREYLRRRVAAVA